jgi:hypothetical protein
MIKVIGLGLLFVGSGFGEIFMEDVVGEYGPEYCYSFLNRI